MALVRQDRHGLFVICNGSIFRPQPDKSHAHCKEVPSQLIKGTKVTATHIRCTTLANVNGETWFSHGPSLEFAKFLMKNSTSEDAWMGK